MRSGYNMEHPVNVRNGNARHIITRVRRDAAFLAGMSAVLGLLVYGAGWVWLAFLAGPVIVEYPADFATVAGIFIGIAIDLGIVVGLVGLILESLGKIGNASARTGEERQEALVSVAPD